MYNSKDKYQFVRFRCEFDRSKVAMKQHFNDLSVLPLDKSQAICILYSNLVKKI